MQPYDMEVGAGTFHPATTLCSLGKRPWSFAYVRAVPPPDRRAIRGKPKPITALLPIPSDDKTQPKGLPSPIFKVIGRHRHRPNPTRHSVYRGRLGKPNARRVGARVGGSGATAMEVSQFTYFQQVCGHDCRPVTGGNHLWGWRRLAMYILGIDHVMDMPYNDPTAPIPLKYKDIFLQKEREYARWNFDVADTDMLFAHFKDAESECTRILDTPARDAKRGTDIVHGSSRL